MRPLFPQPPNPGCQFFANLETVATGNNFQLIAPPFAVALDLRQRVADIGVRRSFVLVKQLTELSNGQRFTRGHQGTFQDFL